jgi:hypothetical protein
VVGGYQTRECVNPPQSTTKDLSVIECTLGWGKIFHSGPLEAQGAQNGITNNRNLGFYEKLKLYFFQKTRKIEKNI